MESVFNLLDREWARIGTERSFARELPDVLALVGVGTLAEVVEHERTLNLEAKDQLHARIVAHAVAGDRLAGRLELQLLLPGAASLAARFWSLGDHEERASAAMAAVYGSILRYPVARRPRYVAANILVGAAQRLRRAIQHPDRHVSGSDDPTGPFADLVDPEGVHPAEELLDVLLDAVTGGVLSSSDARLIAATRIGARRLADIAEHTGTSLRSVERRRQRAERALCTMAVAA